MNPIEEKNKIRKCLNCDRQLNGIKFDYCKYCRSFPEFSQAKYIHCKKCNKDLGVMKSISGLCNMCRPIKSRTQQHRQREYQRKRKSEINNIPTYSKNEVKEFVENYELDFKRLQPKEFLLQMLKTIQYHESCCFGTESLRGEVSEQLRFMYKELYLYVYPKKNRRPKDESGRFIKINKSNDTNFSRNNNV